MWTPPIFLSPNDFHIDRRNVRENISYLENWNLRLEPGLVSNHLLELYERSHDEYNMTQIGC